MRSPVALTAAVAFVLVACNSENRPIADTGTAGTLPVSNGKEELEGALHEPLATVSATEFKRAVKTIRSWNGGDSANRCTDFPLCGLGLSKVPVTIEPAFDAANASFANVSANGTILMRMKNVGGGRKTGRFARYQLEPGATYYVVVRSADGVKGTWDLVPFDTANLKDPVKSSQNGRFHDCAHYQKLPKSKAAFYSCDEAKEYANKPPAALQKASVAGAAIVGLSALAHIWVTSIDFFLQSTGWVSCAFGCCTLESM